jgi:hypothetical protein
MQVTSRKLNGGIEKPPSQFSEEEHIKCMSQITPVVIGLSKITQLLKAARALTEYSGGRRRRRHVVRDPSPDRSVAYRLHHLRPVEHKGGTVATRVGLGRGWEKYGQGVPVDSPRRKFKV